MADNIRLSFNKVLKASQEALHNSTTTTRTTTRNLSKLKLNKQQPNKLTTIVTICAIFNLTICLLFSILIKPTLATQSIANFPPTPSADEVNACEACKLVVRSFEKGLEETSRGKHEGGDTSWEEKNLKSYSDSEVRLVEIQESLCEDAKKGKAQCLSLVEYAESDIEDWWFNHRNKKIRLHDYLCISKLKKCCPNNHFGQNCQPCPSKCNGHGSCDGEETRDGTGKCICEPGYIGDNCEDCAEDRYRIATNAVEQFTCEECDLACKGCFGYGPRNCTECRDGYYKHETNGCIDINECDDSMANEHGSDARLCKGNTYCVNTIGGFKCADCHVACSGCVGYGPNMCLSCALGYRLDDEYTCRERDEVDRKERWERFESNIFLEWGLHTLFSLVVFVMALMMFIELFRYNTLVMCTVIIVIIVSLLQMGDGDFLYQQPSQISSE